MSLQTFGRNARLKRLSKGPLLESYDRLCALPPTDENKAAAAEVLSQICAATRAETKIPAYGMLPAIGSPMEYLLADFAGHNFIPLGIPFWTVMARVSQMLCECGVEVDLGGGQKMLPILYTLVLADSGDCKTWTNKQFDDVFPKMRLLSEPKSAEGLLVQVVEFDGKAALLIKDEFGRAWVRWMSDPDKALIQDVFLTAYTQEPFDLKLKNASYTCRRPIISILGFTQRANFSTHFTAADWQSGLIQRFIVASCAPVADWEDNLDLTPLAEKLTKPGGSLEKLKALVAATPIHETYSMDAAARGYLKHHMSAIVRKLKVGKSFSIRARYNAVKFALLFHYLHGKDTAVLDRDDMEYAMKLVQITLSDLTYLIDETEKSDLVGFVDKSLAARTKLESGGYNGAHGKQPWSKAWLCRSVAGIDKTNVNTIFELTNMEWDARQVVAFEEAAPALAV